MKQRQKVTRSATQTVGHNHLKNSLRTAHPSRLSMGERLDLIVSFSLSYLGAVYVETLLEGKAGGKGEMRFFSGLLTNLTTERVFNRNR